MLRVAIVEDDMRDFASLRNALNLYAEEHAVKFDVTHFADAENFLEKYNPVYDLVFMDIELNGMNGMRAAKKLRQLDNAVILIFVTNMKQYVLNGYEVNALNYILKPIQYASLSLTMDRAIRAVTQNNDKFLLIKLDGEIKRITHSDIYCLEIMKHDIIIYTEQGDISLYGTLSEYEKRLNNNFFFRCNAYTIINIRHVKSISENEVTLTNGKKVSLSRRRRKEFLQTVTECLGGIV